MKWYAITIPLACVVIYVLAYVACRSTGVIVAWTEGFNDTSWFLGIAANSGHASANEALNGVFWPLITLEERAIRRLRANTPEHR